MGIMEAYADRKSYDMVLLAWNLGAPMGAEYSIFRSMTSSGPYKKIAATKSTAHIDRDTDVLTNQFLFYKIISGNRTSGELVAGYDADPQLYEAAKTLLWKLDEGRSGVKAEAFCKGVDSRKCPECWSESLNKRIKSQCSTCDGSGQLSSFAGPIELFINITNISETTNNIGSTKEEVVNASAWTGNIPLFRKGDIIVVGHERYMVNSIPEKQRMTSENNRMQFIIRQKLLLALLDKSHSAYNLGDNDVFSG